MGRPAFDAAVNALLIADAFILPFLSFKGFCQ
jgi:hypothetical protein